MDALLGQPRAALRRKDVGPFGIMCRLEVLTEGLARFVDEIDITPFAPFVSDMEPTDLWTNVGMNYFQPGHITDPASGPIAERKKRGSSPILRLFDQRPENIALVL